MDSSSQDPALRGRNRLPTELNALVIEQLPMESLLQAALVCSQFQLEAEVHIYKSITIDHLWRKKPRFRTLKEALLSKTRRKALVTALEIAVDLNLEMDLYVESLKFLLPTLSNVKILKVPHFGESDGLDSAIFLDTQSQFEEVAVTVLSGLRNLKEFYASQPRIRRLSVLRHYREELPEIPAAVLPVLEDLTVPLGLTSLYVLGRPVTKVMGMPS